MAHLQDVESSFVPPISPIPVAGPEGGVDDTYLFDVSPTKRDQPAHQPAHQSANRKIRKEREGKNKKKEKAARLPTDQVRSSC